MEQPGRPLTPVPTPFLVPLERSTEQPEQRDINVPSVHKAVPSRSDVPSLFRECSASCYHAQKRKKEGI